MSATSAFMRSRGMPFRVYVLVFRGRECGRSRLAVTAETSPAHWVMRNAQSARVNGRPTTPSGARRFLSSQRSGVSDVVLTNGDVSQTFQFEFSLAEEEDLQGVDAALARLIDGGELSLRAIDDFIMRSKPYPTASPVPVRLGGLPVRCPCS